VSAAEVYNNPSDPWNWAALALDLTAAVIPFVPAGAGLVIRAARVAGNTDKLATVAQFAAKTKSAFEKTGLVKDVMDTIKDAAEDFQLDRGLAIADFMGGGPTDFEAGDSVLSNAFSALFSASAKAVTKKVFGLDDLGAIQKAVIGSSGNLLSSGLMTLYNGEFAKPPTAPNKELGAASGSFVGSIFTSVNEIVGGHPAQTRSIGRITKFLGGIGSFAAMRAQQKPEFEKRQ
jgi:hypothetical protein